MVHIPFVMGAISIFHNVPAKELGGKPIDLTGCLLARIFSRKITTWDDPAIKAVNPSLSVPAGTPIKVVHRVLGSSSTAGTTEYLEKTCPQEWTLGSGKTITWPSGTFEGQGSDGVAEFIDANQYAIGYLDAGHGQKLGFGEIALENKAGTYLTSKDADIGAAGAEALKAAVIPSDPTGDWSGVNLYDLPGAKTWPITMWSYVYVRKDLSNLDPRTAGLLKAFLEYTLSAEGQDSATEFGFSKVPPEILEYNVQTIASLKLPASAPTFAFELASKTQKGDGAGLHMLS